MFNKVIKFKQIYLPGRVDGNFSKKLSRLLNISLKIGMIAPKKLITFGPNG